MSVAQHAASGSGGMASDALARLRAEAEHAERFLTEVAGQLEGLWDQLEEGCRMLGGEGERLRRLALQQAEERDRQWAEIAAGREQVREEVRRALGAAAGAMAEAGLEVRRHWAQERAQWLDELHRMRELLEQIALREGKP